jgi:excinuclease ABC subunit C
MRLPEDNGALRLLQRIRDEAHRTANGYHSLLLKKRVRESLLDAIPGVSAKRKQLLLGTFGSVDRIKSLTPAEIAALPGFSIALATRIVTSLANGRDSS